jgi:Aspartyl protease
MTVTAGSPPWWKASLAMFGCKAILTPAVVLTVFLGVFAQSYNSQKPDVSQKTNNAAISLDDLVQRKDYPQLERQLSEAKLSSDERAYFQGILADRSNHILTAISLLEQILPDLRAKHPHRAALALRTLAGDYFKLGRYVNSCDAYADLLSHFPNEFGPAELQTIRDNLHTFQLFRDAPPQTVSGNPRFTLPMRTDATGDLDIPVEVHGVKQWWILDTGANESVIAMSTAKQMGLTISEKSAQTQSGATASEAPVKGAVIPELILGGATVHNVVVLIMDDKSLDVPVKANEHYQIRGVLGYPVLAALGSFTLDRDKWVIAPESEPSPRSGRLYVEELTPLFEATIADSQVLFGLDTGSSSGNFSKCYLQRFPDQFTSLKPQKYATAGAGGDVRFLMAYYLPQIELWFGTAQATLSNVPVLTSDLGVDPLDQVYGNLGQTLLTQFGSFTIDFTRMRFSVGENSPH